MSNPMRFSSRDALSFSALVVRTFLLASFRLSRSSQAFCGESYWDAQNVMMFFENFERRAQRVYSRKDILNDITKQENFETVRL
jgi:hypothetical protein